MDRMRKVLREFYIRACLDVLNKKNKGKGKHLCEDRIDVIIPVIRKAIVSELPKEKIIHPPNTYLGGEHMEFTACVCILCKEAKIYNQCLTDIKQKLLGGERDEEEILLCSRYDFINKPQIS